MKTAEIIAQLSDQLHPVPRHGLALRLAPILLCGAISSAAAMVLWLGIRPDLMAAMHTPGYWIKFGYTAALATAGGWLLVRLSRPGSAIAAPALAVLAIAGGIAIVALDQWASAPAASRWHLMMGGSSDVCPWRIVALGLPIFAAALFAVRRLAPTRLVLAGAAIGLFSGALGAWIYAFHCDESAGPFIAVWYTFGIALVAAAGAGLGRLLLRW
jgi:hypothetical protein